MIRVVVADDQALVRDGLRAILELAGIDVVGEAATGAGVLIFIDGLIAGTLAGLFFARKPHLVWRGSNKTRVRETITVALVLSLLGIAACYMILLFSW